MKKLTPSYGLLGLQRNEDRRGVWLVCRVRRTLGSVTVTGQIAQGAAIRSTRLDNMRLIDISVEGKNASKEGSRLSCLNNGSKGSTQGGKQTIGNKNRGGLSVQSHRDKKRNLINMSVHLGRKGSTRVNCRGSRRREHFNAGYTKKPKNWLRSRRWVVNTTKKGGH